MLAFDHDQRPDGAAFLRAVDQLADVAVTLDRTTALPTISTEGCNNILWLELCRDGLTFDCTGLAPGRAHELPSDATWFGEGADRPDAGMPCIGLTLGPHLRGGQSSPTIFRSLAQLASDFAGTLRGCRSVCWTASGAVIDRPAFVDAIQRWTEGGPIPARFFISVRSSPDGMTETFGLAYFTGQELLVDRTVCAGDRAETDRLALRIAEQMMYRGTLAEPEHLVSTAGLPLSLQPTPDGRLVRVLAG
ncbi:hypothetical protein WAB17_12770 [Parerythrobacter aurantius]|uniref:hypothetical protein n=1 Tax=Parerythrobacter aurantius TaxID=3127706 RepID=UPI00324AC232